MKKNKVLVLTLIFSIILSCFTIISFADSGKYVALGDSIPAGYGLSKESERYPNILSGKTGLTLYNYAWSGHKTSDLLSRMKNSKVKTALSTAKLVTVSIGGNDFISDASSVLSALANDDESFNQCEANFNLITEYLLANTPKNCIIIYQNVGNCYKYTFYGSFVSNALKRLNNIIKNQCDGKRVFYCDVATNLEKSSDNFFASQGGDYAFDPHPTAKGHVSIANDIYQTYLSAKNVINSQQETTTISTTYETTSAIVETTTQKSETQETSSKIIVETTETTQPTITTQETTESAYYETTETTSIETQESVHIEETTETTSVITTKESTYYETTEVTTTIKETTSVQTSETTHRIVETTSDSITTEKEIIETKEPEVTTIPPRIDQTTYVSSIEETTSLIQTDVTTYIETEETFSSEIESTQNITETIEKIDNTTKIEETTQREDGKKTLIVFMIILPIIAIVVIGICIFYLIRIKNKQ